MNSELTTLIIFGIVACVVAATIPALIVVYQIVAIRSTLRSVKFHFNGDIVEQGLFRAPKFKFQENDANFYLDVRMSRTHRTKRVFHLQAVWREPGFRMTVIPESTEYGRLNLMGMQDVEIDDEQFDGEFFLQTNDPEEAKNKLKPEVQAVLFEIEKIGRFNYFSFNIMGSTVSLEKELPAGDAKSLIYLIEQFLKLYFNLLTDDAQVVAVIKSVKLSGTPTCMVCGDLIDQRRVECRSCKTAHHEECWEYFGKCSTFACGQRKYRRQKTRKHYIGA